MEVLLWHKNIDILIEYLEQGHTLRETGDKFGFTYKEMRDLKTRYNKRQCKLAAGIENKPKGRPRKDGAKLPPSVQQCRFFGVSRSGYYGDVSR